MLAISPYLAFKGNCREAIEFYQDALDAEVLFKQTVGEAPLSHTGPQENIMHCTIKVGDTTMMLCDDPGPTPSAGSGAISLAVGLTDPERAHQIFGNLAQGGTVVMPLTKTYWAAAFGMVTDKFGIRWMVNCDAPK